jgi:guanylate kinase
VSRYSVDLLNVSGPYGVGKDTLLQAVLERYGPRVHRVSTLTTRPTSSAADPSYRSLTQSEFLAETARGDWIVNYQLSGTVAYATSLDEINFQSSEGRLCVHSIYAADSGAGELRRRLGKRLISVGVLAASGGVEHQLNILRERLIARGRDEQETIRLRLSHQQDAIEYILTNQTVIARDRQEYEVFDHIIVNDELSGARDKILDIASVACGQRSLYDSPTDHELWVKSEWRSYGGGTYFNPVSDVPLKGRKVLIPEIASISHIELTKAAEPTYVATRLFKILTSYLQKGEVLLGMYVRGTTQFAPLLGDAVDVVTYESQVQKGALICSGYYAMSEEAANVGFMTSFPST